MALIVGTLGDDRPLNDPVGDDDTIFGDSAAVVNLATGSDRIFGRDGDDVIAGDAPIIGPLGKAGDDIIFGGDGSDTIYGDASKQLFGRGGNDIIYQNGGPGRLIGDALEVEGGARGGNDQLFGGGTLVGDSVFEIASGRCGNDILDASAATVASFLYGDVEQGDLDGNTVGGWDRLSGGRFRDLLVGDAEDVDDIARGGDDRLWGDAGGDVLCGDAEQSIFERGSGGDDVLRGGAGWDVLYGDAPLLADFATGGDDILYGGNGDDELWGDGELDGSATGGRDRFVFGGTFGDDTVQDFRPGEDVLAFEGFDRADVELTLDAGDRVVTVDGVHTVRLVDFAGSLTFGVDLVFA
jgi:Ca2+-binding RTX toxin-like protein